MRKTSPLRSGVGSSRREPAVHAVERALVADDQLARAQVKVACAARGSCRPRRSSRVAADGQRRRGHVEVPRLGAVRPERGQAHASRDRVRELARRRGGLRGERRRSGGDIVRRDVARRSGREGLAELEPARRAELVRGRVRMAALGAHHRRRLAGGRVPCAEARGLVHEPLRARGDLPDRRGAVRGAGHGRSGGHRAGPRRTSRWTCGGRVRRGGGELLGRTVTRELGTAAEAELVVVLIFLRAFRTDDHRDLLDALVSETTPRLREDAALALRLCLSSAPLPGEKVGAGPPPRGRIFATPRSVDSSSEKAISRAKRAPPGRARREGCLRGPAPPPAWRWRARPPGAGSPSA
jgi:hypothetical protein